MKQHLLLVFAMLMTMVFGTNAQTTELFYPSFQYDSGKGFTRKVVVNEGSIAETNLWKRINLVTGLDYGYSPATTQKYLSITSVVAPKSFKTEAYAVLDAINFVFIFLYSYSYFNIT